MANTTDSRGSDGSRAQGDRSRGARVNGAKTQAPVPSANGTSLSQAGKAAKTIVGRQIDAALGAAGNRVGNTAKSVREIGDQLRDGGEAAFAADLAQTVAGYVDRVATYLRESDSETFVVDIETYGRKHPVVIAGAAFATGLLASRFVKVSSAERYFSVTDNRNSQN